MARRFDLIVFDWDGTLMDSPAAIVAAIQSACSDLGIRAPSDERARHIIGLGLEDALRYALPWLPASEYPRMAERYRSHYLAQDHTLRLFPGAYDLVAALSKAGVKLAVATGKARHGLDRALQTSGLGCFFHATRCADECPSKPDPAMLLEIMATLGVRAQRTLMVGDTTHDLEMARAAGVDSLAVAFGAHPESRLSVAASLGCAATVEELRVWLTALV